MPSWHSRGADLVATAMLTMLLCHGAVHVNWVERVEEKGGKRRGSRADQRHDSRHARAKMDAAGYNPPRTLEHLNATATKDWPASGKVCLESSLI
jgi:hypothetical protein